MSRATDRATAKPHKFVARFYVTTTPLFCKLGGIGKKTPPQKFLLVAKNPQLNFLWAADPFPCCVYKTYKQPTTHTNHCSVAYRSYIEYVHNEKLFPIFAVESYIHPPTTTFAINQ